MIDYTSKEKQLLQTWIRTALRGSCETLLLELLQIGGEVDESIAKSSYFAELITKTDSDFEILVKLCNNLGYPPAAFMTDTDEILQQSGIAELIIQGRTFAIERSFSRLQKNGANITQMCLKCLQLPESIQVPDRVYAFLTSSFLSRVDELPGSVAVFEEMRQRIEKVLGNSKNSRKGVNYHSRYFDLCRLSSLCGQNVSISAATVEVLTRSVSAQAEEILKTIQFLGSEYLSGVGKKFVMTNQKQVNEKLIRMFWSNITKNAYTDSDQSILTDSLRILLEGKNISEKELYTSLRHSNHGQLISRNGIKAQLYVLYTLLPVFGYSPPKNWELSENELRLVKSSLKLDSTTQVVFEQMETIQSMIEPELLKTLDLLEIMQKTNKAKSASKL